MLNDRSHETLNLRIKQIIAPYVDAPDDPAQLPDRAILADLGLDSMRSINLLLDLEQTFGLVFPDEALAPENFVSVQAVEALVGHLLKRVDHVPA